MTRPFQLSLKNLRYKLRTTRLRVPLVWYRHWGASAAHDVYLASYQRSGSTWLRFLLCEALAGDGADFESVKFTIPDIRHYRRGAALLPGGGRLIKTHEPYRRGYKKALYVVRDPRDVAISLYEYDRPNQSLDEFVNSFVRGKATSHGTWQNHIRSWMHSPLVDSGKILVVKYETLRTNTHVALDAILRFLSVPAGADLVARAIANNDLNRMREKEDRARSVGVEVSGETIRSRGLSVRRGAVGEWRERLNESQARFIEVHARESMTDMGYLSASVHPRLLDLMAAPKVTDGTDPLLGSVGLLGD